MAEQIIPTIKQKIVICAVMEAKSPLRIGSGQTDGLTDLLVLKNSQGNPFIPGTSLAGVLRRRIADLYGKALAELVFGIAKNEESHQSLINISDIVLKNSQLVYRDGVKLDPVARTAVAKAKYDFEAVERGVSGAIQLEMTIRENHLQLANQFKDVVKLHPQFDNQPGGLFLDIAATVADLLYNGLEVGSLTTKGLGKISAKDKVKCCWFDFSKADMVEAWLAYASNCQNCPKPIYEGRQVNDLLPKNTFKVSLTLSLRSSILVRDYFVDGAEKDASNKVAVMLKSNNQLVIPGTSVKGVLRSQALDILKTLCKYDSDKFKDLMGYADDEAKFKSRLSVDEVYFTAATKEQFRIRRDRFTGGTIQGGLFSEEPAWRAKEGTNLTLNFEVANCTEEDAGLMLLVIKKLWFGRAAFGGGKNIGRGIMQGESGRIDYAGKTYSLTRNAQAGIAVNGDIASLDKYIKVCIGE